MMFIKFFSFDGLNKLSVSYILEQTLQKKEEKDSFKNGNLNSKKKNAAYNNFIDDRFGGDFSAEQDTPKLDEHKEVIKTGSLWHENFFYKISDPRFKGNSYLFLFINILIVDVVGLMKINSDCVNCY